ncbi:glycosyltransferase [Lacinutrix sp. C3R15]|uniref:glycosyltransferase n=1 Tax=Flavobacteriaceae TaxID=49546 RepID=UPI001C0980B4|nr:MULTISPECIES: glycosyltransferase [Flavobacteriaceae]MBU2939588.1 glycosyltransferase [Lacinutrix sp. C3R15]MDO6622902.1 glycosyltransferase [Oceanihabitans sp. 1_MG-2023]
MKTLTIISHTEHYKNPDGSIVGLGATVTEINHLTAVFDRILHVAMLHDVPAPPSALPYTSNKITCIALPAVGGTGIQDKFAIIYKAPKIIATIQQAIQQTDYFQFRAPTGIGVFVIPYLMFFSKKKGWFKYAGNWKQEHAPLAYSLQRWLLKKQKRKVTINGSWPDQPKQCLTFENPCLTEAEVAEGKALAATKSIEAKALRFCFVGRLETEKGLGLLIAAFKNLNAEEKKRIQEIAIVGDGKAKQKYMDSTKNSGLPFVFHGFLSRDAVHNIYKVSHAIVLPSASEGFPKVIAEAMNYGCLPIVSNVSSIGQYVQSDNNGFLLDTISVESLLAAIRKVVYIDPKVFSTMLNHQKNAENRFTYAYYNQRITNALL